MSAPGDCLSTSGLIMGIDSKTALVMSASPVPSRVSISAEPKVKTVIPVDPAGDGGLMNIVLSPTYSQDRLMYAYISTPSANRVVRWPTATSGTSDHPQRCYTGR